MPRALFADQNNSSGTVLLRELTTIMEAHIAFEEADGGGIVVFSGGSEKDGQKSGGDAGRSPAAFQAKMLESSRKYGGASMLYHGKL